MKKISPSDAHIAFRNDVLVILNKHAGLLDASEMLALAAYTVGQIMAMQDARRWTPELMLEMVGKNIEEGNAQAIANSGSWMGHA